ncbi:MAG: hypothetical protein IJV88_02785 [Ruminococcus sp.]|nr:hypothetical protein [Ruminococcus sp.]
MAYSAYKYSDRGYDLSLFETEGTSAPKPAPARARKKKPENNIVLLHQMEFDKASRRKHNVAGLVWGFMMAAVIVLIVGVMIHGQVRLAELNQQINAAETTLSHRVSEYTQMQAKVEASLSTAVVEEYARTELGMQKATNQQKEYITLSHGDKAEVYTQSSESIFTVVGNFFDSLWS